MAQEKDVSQPTSASIDWILRGIIGDETVRYRFDPLKEWLRSEEVTEALENARIDLKSVIDEAKKLSPGRITDAYRLMLPDRIEFERDILASIQDLITSVDEYDKVTMEAIKAFHEELAAHLENYQDSVEHIADNISAALSHSFDQKFKSLGIKKRGNRENASQFLDEFDAYNENFVAIVDALGDVITQKEERRDEILHEREVEAGKNVVSIGVATGKKVRERNRPRPFIPGGTSKDEPIPGVSADPDRGGLGRNFGRSDGGLEPPGSA